MIRNQAVSLFFEAFQTGQRFDAVVGTLTPAVFKDAAASVAATNALVKLAGVVGLYRLDLTAAETDFAAVCVRLTSSDSTVTVVQCGAINAYLPSLPAGTEGGLPVLDGNELVPSNLSSIKGQEVHADNEVTFPDFIASPTATVDALLAKTISSTGTTLTVLQKLRLEEALLLNTSVQVSEFVWAFKSRDGAKTRFTMTVDPLTRVQTMTPGDLT